VTATKQLEVDRGRLLTETYRQRDLLKMVFDHVPLGLMFRRGPELVGELVNDVYRTMFSDLVNIGLPFSSLSSPESKELEVRLREVLSSGRSHCKMNMPYRVSRENEGGIEQLYMTSYDIRVPSPSGDGVLSLAIDTTDHMRSRRKFEELVAVAQRQAAELESIH